ncbi:MAG: hydroxyacid dehydrogenase, partial [Candidatus Omnitrophica bacterium]|nr:hydroxyacid dehydrogenase [Candidatus Omnitrophota bacterium]
HLKDNFKVIELEDPSDDSNHILSEAEIILAPLGYYLNKEKIDQAHKLKIIASNTTGHPHIDFAYAKKKNIKVITLADYPDFLKTITPTAELTWGLIISLTRNVFAAGQSVKAGKWDRRPFGGKAMLSRLSLGIAGLGRLGTMVAGYAKAFSMKVCFYDPFINSYPETLKKADTLQELVSQSDIVTVHIPHTRDNENLFDENIFSKFKKGSFFINTSRGELVDHKALLANLENKHLAGAAIDVFEGEFLPGFKDKLKNHPLVEYARHNDNLIITPHIGGSTYDAWGETERFTIDKIIQTLNLCLQEK